MKNQTPPERWRPYAAWLVCACLCWGTELQGADYFLTIGGGYQPDGNQASLEANVLFFRDILLEKHTGQRTEAVFFADGNDPGADLQVLSQPVTAAAANDQTANTSVTDLLDSLYSFRGNQTVEYRNHRITNVSGANAPASIRASLQHMCQAMGGQDRLFVYVTAHGSEAKGRNKFNTSISCWEGQSISAREFENWLDDVPQSVPVIMVMAQCYCGGFAHTIFENADRSRGLAPQLRVGFFAQQHDLPAAGCRPDIENDEEFSSYFWGAFIGRSRTGNPMSNADFNGDGQISLAEAHAHAVLTSPTIDIPLRASEELLRAYSAIADYDHRGSHDSDVPVAHTSADSPAEVPLASMSGAVTAIAVQATVEMQRTVSGLLIQLNLQPADDISILFNRLEELRDAGRDLRRTTSRGRRRGSGRRELRTEIAEQWPELSGRDWRAAEILHVDDQSALRSEIEQLPSYSRFYENQQTRDQTAGALEQNELREVKFQRLINTLEAIVLAQNLPQLAPPEVLQHYQRMIALEQSTLSPPAANAK